MTTPAYTAFGRYDVAIVGAGHNGLVAAAYLARAGLSVLVLERLERVGGAAASSPAVRRPADPDLPLRVDLVSLLPRQLIGRPRLDLRLASRPMASYTPVVRDGRHRRLLVERPEGKRDAHVVPRADRRQPGVRRLVHFYAEVAALARVVEPTLLAAAAAERAGSAAQRRRRRPGATSSTTPLGEVIEHRFADDTVRGIVAADALLGTFASLHDPSLVPEPLLPLPPDRATAPASGGCRSAAWARSPTRWPAAAARAGAEIRTGAGVSRDPGRRGRSTRSTSTRRGGPAHGRGALRARQRRAVGAAHPARRAGRPGDQAARARSCTINFLLDRLPRLKSGIDPAVAFAGTLHVAEGYSQLETAYAEARGRPAARPRSRARSHCHTLTDPSILGDAPPGTHTLTFFGLHTPASLFESDPHAAARTRRYAARSPPSTSTWSTRSSRASPRTRTASRASRRRIPQDIEAELAMPGGHIFHGDLEWPWANNRARLDTPAQQWGVQTGCPGASCAGAGARRGGAVSGIAGHNAAQAVLASR